MRPFFFLPYEQRGGAFIAIVRFISFAASQQVLAFLSGVQYMYVVEVRSLRHPHCDRFMFQIVLGVLLVVSCPSATSIYSIVQPLFLSTVPDL